MRNQHSLQKLTSTHFQFHSPYSEITQFMAEKLLANIEDDPIPNTKVKRIIRRFTEPYIQHLSFSGVLLPLCGRYNKAHKTPNTPNPNFPVEYSKTKKLSLWHHDHGILAGYYVNMKSTFTARIDMYPNSLTISPTAFSLTDKTHSNPTCKITPKTKLKKIPKQQAQDRFKKAEACKTGPIPR